MKKWCKTIITITVLILISACSNNQNVSEQLLVHIEKTVEIEAEFIENQEKIFELEKKDQSLYNEIIGMGSNDYEKIVDLSTEAIALLDERLQYVKLEKKSLHESQKEFEQIEPLIDSIENVEQKEQVEKMFKTMMNRYSAYEKVFESYSKSIELTKDLYTLFQQKEFKENEVYSVLANVNDSYDVVLKANESFNKETVLYNSLKEEYYYMLSEK